MNSSAELVAVVFAYKTMPDTANRLNTSMYVRLQPVSRMVAGGPPRDQAEDQSRLSA